MTGAGHSTSEKCHLGQDPRRQGNREQMADQKFGSETHSAFRVGLSMVCLWFQRQLRAWISFVDCGMRWWLTLGSTQNTGWPEEKMKIKFVKEVWRKLASAPEFEFPSASILRKCRWYSTIEQSFKIYGVGVESLESWVLIIVSVNKKEVENELFCPSNFILSLHPLENGMAVICKGS